ncbi:MAG: hypothetical protein L0K86_17930, partial [Actinomycetia bacterium]|nr:hypothetical protein [Actinomycetes bacterium]
MKPFRRRRRGGFFAEFDVHEAEMLVNLEAQLIERAGPDAGGNLQIARSRNDLDAVMARQMVRDRLLVVQEQIFDVREALLDLIGQHHETLMPGVT